MEKGERNGNQRKNKEKEGKMREQETTVQVHFDLAGGQETTYKCNASL